MEVTDHVPESVKHSISCQFVIHKKTQSGETKKLKETGQKIYSMKLEKYG